MKNRKKTKKTKNYLLNGETCRLPYHDQTHSLLGFEKGGNHDYTTRKIKKYKDYFLKTMTFKKRCIVFHN